MSQYPKFSKNTASMNTYFARMLLPVPPYHISNYYCIDFPLNLGETLLQYTNVADSLHYCRLAYRRGAHVHASD